MKLKIAKIEKLTYIALILVIIHNDNFLLTFKSNYKNFL